LTPARTWPLISSTEASLQAGLVDASPVSSGGSTVGTGSGLGVATGGGAVTGGGVAGTVAVRTVGAKVAAVDPQPRVPTATIAATRSPRGRPGW
jgi:hypothetical protein